MVNLTAPVPNWGTTSGVWFIFPDALQPFVKPWIKSMIPALPDVVDRKLYRGRITKAAMADKYSQNVWAKSSVGHTSFCIYAQSGDWRCGMGRDVHARFILDAQADIIAAVAAFSQSK